MAFRYLDQIATQEHIQEFLSLVDLAAGSGQSASNAFLLSHRLRSSAPMQLCEKILGNDQESFRNDTPESELSTHQKRLKTTSYTFRMIHHGLELASQAQLHFPVIWEERMEQNLEELRRELGIEPVKEGPWSWYSQPAIAAAIDLVPPA
jgi:hypothetical protein